MWKKCAEDEFFIIIPDSGFVYVNMMHVWTSSFTSLDCIFFFFF